MWQPMSKAQQTWVLRRDGNRCQKMRFIAGKWIQCETVRGLHVHHIFPKGAMALWLPHLDPHTPENLITLCGDEHHNGESGVHSDMAFARKDYRRGDKKAYVRIMEERALFIERGKPYWNSQWDLLFVLRAKHNNSLYAKAHPEDEFPTTVPKDESE